MEILVSIIGILLKGLFGIVTDSSKDQAASEAKARTIQVNDLVSIREDEKKLVESMRNAGKEETQPENIYDVPTGIFADIL